MTSLSEKSINNSLTRSNSSEIVNWAMPDYTAGVDITISPTEITMDADGIIMGGWSCTNANVKWQIFVNDYVVADTIARGGVSASSTLNIPVRKGDIVKSSHAVGANLDMIFYPYKGG